MIVHLSKAMLINIEELHKIFLINVMSYQKRHPVNLHLVVFPDEYIKNKKPYVLTFHIGLLEKVESIS